MTNLKHYDLEERTLKYTKNVILFTNLLPKTPANTEIIGLSGHLVQLVRTISKQMSHWGKKILP
jgi:hypothetical protein